MSKEQDTEATFKTPFAWLHRVLFECCAAKLYDQTGQKRIDKWVEKF